MSEMEQPESPPRPFPARSPDFAHDHFHGDHSGGDRFGRMYNDDSSINNAASSAGAEDPKSCFIASTMFSFFVAITMAFGLFSPETMRLGPNASILIKPNRLFVESVEVVEVNTAKGSMLYGFYDNPSLDAITTWQETRKNTLPFDTHKEWVYYFNEGSQINISYIVDSWRSSSIVLVIAEGDTELSEWLKKPSYPDTTFSWNIISGNGSFHKDILKSSVYYIGIGNLNPEIVTVNLNLTMKASLYNTTEPYYKCAPGEGKCIFQLFFMGGNTAVLTSPGRVPGSSDNGRVKVSYAPRWITYVVGAGGLILVMLLINYFTNHVRRTDMPTDQLSSTAPERNPLISQKDDYNSESDDGDHEDDAEGEAGPKPVKDGDDSHRSCAICFEAPKDCFFIPCGHCVCCFGCGTRILQTSATCPVCRRRTRRVKKIYTV